jgi:hypothetical protein
VVKVVVASGEVKALPDERLPVISTFDPYRILRSVDEIVFAPLMVRVVVELPPRAFISVADSNGTFIADEAVNAVDKSLNLTLGLMVVCPEKSI